MSSGEARCYVRKWCKRGLENLLWWLHISNQMGSIFQSILERVKFSVPLQKRPENLIHQICWYPWTPDLHPLWFHCRWFSHIMCNDIYWHRMSLIALRDITPLVPWKQKIFLQTSDDKMLTHRGWDRMFDIWQTAFSKAFPWTKTWFSNKISLKYVPWV